MDGEIVVELSEQALEEIAGHLPKEDRDASVETLDRGFSSVVVVRLLDVRVARNDQARAGHLRETLLLPWMDGRLGVDLPVPRRLVEPSLALPFGAIVQPSLQGRVMTAEDGSSESLASEFGRALAAFAWTGLVGCTRGEPSAVGPG